MFLHSKHEIGSIISCCLGNETTLLPRRTDSWTHEFAIVNYHQSDCCLLKSSRQHKSIFLALVVQTLNSAIQQISVRESNCVVHWIEVYPVDRIIHLLINWAMEQIFNSGCKGIV